jgi:hypothetical protein
MTRRGTIRAFWALLLITLLVACSSGGGGSPQAVSGFRTLPHLIYGGTTSEMTLVWQAAATETAAVSWGTDTTYANGTTTVNEQGSDHRFRHTFTGLTPGQTYYYQVALSQQSATGSFLAAPEENSPARLFIYGDTRTTTAGHDQTAAAIIAAYTADPSQRGIALHTGDLVTTGNSAQNWESELFNPVYTNLSRFLTEVPLVTAMGNHEGNGSLFSAHFPYPFAGGRYWSFDYGPVHVAVLDQYLLPGGKIGTDQLAWLTADLAATTRPWKILMMHEPGWSAGVHANNVSVQQDIQPLAKQYGALVFAGHNHFYARAVVDGVQHITTGGGGAPLYPPEPGRPNVVLTEKVHHYCTVSATPTTLLFRAVRLDGSVIDTVTLSK